MAGGAPSIAAQTPSLKVSSNLVGDGDRPAGAGAGADGGARPAADRTGAACRVRPPTSGWRGAACRARPRGKRAAHGAGAARGAPTRRIRGRCRDRPGAGCCPPTRQPPSTRFGRCAIICKDGRRTWTRRREEERVVRLLDNLWLVSGERLTHPWDASAYLIAGDEPTLIDCGSSEGYPQLVASLRDAGYEPRDITRVLATHGHWDHLSAAARLQSESAARLFIHPADRVAVERGDPDRTSAFLYGKPFPPARVDGELAEGDALEINGLTLRVLHTPGHSPGSVCFTTEVGGLKLLIAGDTLWGCFHPRVG